MLTLHSTSLRDGLKGVLDSVEHELVIVSPHIKQKEAKWVCDELEKRISISKLSILVLSDVRSANVLNGSLDIEALIHFCKRIPRSTVINLPRLHAKVFVADRTNALITSANLTPSGMDYNFEYGVRFRDMSLVGKVRADLDAYSRLGNVLEQQALDKLASVAKELSTQYRELQKAAGASLKQRFSQTLKEANHEFLRAQVGSRTAHSLFAEAILYALSVSPLPTIELNPRVQRLLPELCDDTVELVINSERFGKRWKHGVRNAQQYLKKTGQINFDGKVWSRARPHR